MTRQRYWTRVRPSQGRELEHENSQMFTDNSYSPPQQGRELKSERLWSSGAPPSQGHELELLFSYYPEMESLSLLSSSILRTERGFARVQNQVIPIAQF